MCYRFPDDKKGNKMATAKQITAQYIEYIGREVVDNFGGSYQNYDTLGKVWRKNLDYTPKIEAFLMTKTKFFLRLLDSRDQTNFNLIYKVSGNIGEHLSKYLIKKSPDVTRKSVAADVVKDIFLTSERFITKFQSVHKKPVDVTNAHYVATNPGIVAMYISVLKNQNKK